MEDKEMVNALLGDMGKSDKYEEKKKAFEVIATNMESIKTDNPIFKKRLEYYIEALKQTKDTFTYQYLKYILYFKTGLESQLKEGCTLEDNSYKVINEKLSLLISQFEEINNLLETTPLVETSDVLLDYDIIALMLINMTKIQIREFAYNIEVANSYPIFCYDIEKISEFALKWFISPIDSYNYVNWLLVQLKTYKVIQKYTKIILSEELDFTYCNTPAKYNVLGFVDYFSFYMKRKNINNFDSLTNLYQEMIEDDDSTKATKDSLESLKNDIQNLLSMETNLSHINKNNGGSKSNYLIHINGNITDFARIIENLKKAEIISKKTEDVKIIKNFIHTESSNFDKAYRQSSLRYRQNEINKQESFTENYYNFIKLCIENLPDNQIFRLNSFISKMK